MGDCDHSRPGRAASRQGRSVRQQHRDQQPQHSMARKGTVSPCQEEEGAGHTTVRFQHGRLQEGLCEGRSTAELGGRSSISTSSWRRHRRPYVRKIGSQCSQSQRKMENRSERSSIRQAREGSTTAEPDVSRADALLQSGGAQHGQDLCGNHAAKTTDVVNNDLFSSARRPKRFALELFAGTARITSALQDEGIHTYAIDTCISSSHNVLDMKVANHIFNIIASGVVLLVWLGMPCTTFSRARRHDGLGPGPLRDSCNLWGLPHLKLHDQKKLNEGNKLFWFTRHILRLCVLHRVPFVLENPLTSMVWELPPLLALKKSSEAKYCDLDFCQYGERWRKPTRLMYYGIDISSLSRVCTGHLVCSRSHRQHIALKGRDATGMFLTLRAQPYPFELCKCFASVAARALRGVG